MCATSGMRLRLTNGGSSFSQNIPMEGRAKPPRISKGNNQDRKPGEIESPDKSQPVIGRSYSKGGTEVAGEPHTLEVWFPGTHSDM
jgi:hypothetical protein